MTNSTINPFSSPFTDRFSFEVVNFISGRTGSYRFITKCKAGFMICTEADEYRNRMFNNDKDALLKQYKKGALQTIQFKPEGSDNWLTVFAVRGKRVLFIDQDILKELTVGTINDAQGWYDTNLYNISEYNKAGAKTWKDKAYSL